MIYHARNLENLQKLAPHTRVAAMKWYQYCLDNDIEVLVYETLRTLEQQKKNVASGASQTMKSYHLVGQALDFVPINSNGKEDWDGYWKKPWSNAIQYAKQIGFEWGGDWKGFCDSPHLQYNYNGYGTDKGEVEEYKVQEQKEVETWTNKNNISDGSYGTIEAVGGGVNTYTSPYADGQYVQTIQPGTPYRVYGEKDGYYGIGGNQWVNKKYVKLTQYIAVVTPVGGVNVYDIPSWNGNYKSTLAAGVGYAVYGEKDGWYLLGGNVWVDGQYVMIK